MRMRFVALSLICLMAQGWSAEDSGPATVLDGRRLFFDDATRRRIDAGIAGRKAVPETARSAPAAEPSPHSLGAGSRAAGAVKSGVTGHATVDGRLGRQRIVDGVPLRVDSP